MDLTVEVGRTFGILSESGSGKTTLLRLAAFILRPSAGRVRGAGVDPWALRPAARRQLRRRVQLVLQFSSDPLDPLQRAIDTVAEPLANFGVPARQRREQAAAALASVGLTLDLAGRYPTPALRRAAPAGQPGPRPGAGPGRRTARRASQRAGPELGGSGT